MTVRDGTDVRLLRWRAGLRQWRLAAEIGYSPTVLCDIEAGRKPLTPDLACRIEEAASRLAEMETREPVAHEAGAR